MRTRIGEFSGSCCTQTKPGWFFRLFLSVVSLTAALFFAAPARAADRRVIQSSWPAVVAHLTPVGQPTNGTRLNLALGLPVRNPAALTSLLHDIYDPASPEFHHYLTPDQFTARFGPTEADYQSVLDFARANGWQVTATHPNRLLLDVSGTVPEVERALHITLHTYRHPTENRTFFAPDSPPSLDSASPVVQISGLDNYSLPRPQNAVRPADSGVRPLDKGENVTTNTGSGPGGSYQGNDFRAAYVPDTPLTGSSQAVGLLEFDGYTPADITYYETQAGLPNVTLQNVLLDGFNGTPTFTGNEIETTLDIELAIAMAPGLSKVIVYEAGPQGNWHDLLNRMATDNAARQLSCSWYINQGTNDPVADQIWQEMAVQGQSFFSASGDNDAWTGLINFPSDSPYITQVGGTTLTTSGPQGSWLAETVWNYGGSAGGSGGGISTQYPIPSWQTNLSMAANQGSTTMRNTPDVALTADNIYVRADGLDFEDLWGTRCAAPLWAGFAALVNEQAGLDANPPIGFINPALTAIGQGPGYAACFHDITTGNNESTASPARFSAVAGYDLCTGWGTPAGQTLINTLANPATLVITPPAGFTALGGPGGPFTVTNQTLTLTNLGILPLTWSLVNTSAWLTVSPTGGTLTPGGPATAVTVSLNPAADRLGLGTYTTAVWFTNLFNNASQGRFFTLSVLSPPIILQPPAGETVEAAETAQFAVVAQGAPPLAYQWFFNATNGAQWGHQRDAHPDQRAAGPGGRLFGARHQSLRGHQQRHRRPHRNPAAALRSTAPRHDRMVAGREQRPRCHQRWNRERIFRGGLCQRRGGARLHF